MHLSRQLELYRNINKQRRNPRNTEDLKLAGGVIAFLAASAFSGFFLLADSKVDILGDYPRKEMNEAEKLEQFSRSWTSESRFNLQYLGGTVDFNPGGNGLHGIFHKNGYPIGDDCLNSSAYDSRPSEIRGLADGDISAAAAVTEEDGIIRVYPSGGTAPALNFDVNEYGVLQPLDELTLDTTRAYGCSLSHLPGANEVPSIS